ncbi:MAG: hypothetical protein K6G50_04295 [bacterium]|nr:hypothetical protein [bacterium]
MRLFLSVAVILAFCENYFCFAADSYPDLRLTGPNYTHFDGQPLLEKMCGWVCPPHDVCWRETETVLESSDDLGRRPAPYVPSPRNACLALGCSYTFGYGVKDHDNLFWRIGEHFTDTRFDNFATSGYGTVQCRVRLEELLNQSCDPAAKDMHVHYDYVFYGLNSDHLRRNGNLRWNEEDGNYIIFPWAENYNGGILYHEPGAIRWPGSNLFMSIVFLRNMYINYEENRLLADVDWLNLEGTREASPEKEELIGDRLDLFNGILAEMLEISQNYGAEFYVLFLNGKMDNLIYPELKKKGLHTLDISFPFIGKEEYYVLPHCEGHPNALVHKAWAESFIKQMDGKL